MSRDSLKQGVEKKHLGSGGIMHEDMQFGRKQDNETPAAPQRLQLNADSKPAQDTGKHSQHRPQQQGKEQENPAANTNPVSDVRQNVNTHSGIKAHVANSASSHQSKHKHQSGNYSADNAAKPSTAARADDSTQPDNQSSSQRNTGNKTGEPQATPKLQSGDSSKLSFRNAENAPDATKLSHDKKFLKAEKQAKKASTKLDKAKSKLPAKRKLKRLTYENAKTGEMQRKLKFEKTLIPQSEHMKGALPLRPVKAVTNTAIVHAHRKLYQVENENVSVKAAHRLEMGGEVGVRSALRHHKAAPYKKVAKLERKAAKKSVNLSYRKALAENPKLKSNVFSRAMQKRRIKKDYAKAAREAKKAAKKATSASRKIVESIARHPVISIILIIVILIMMFVIPFVGSCAGLISSTMSSVVLTTYLAADDDMYAAEDAYAAMEKDLQDKLDNYETLYPGYDEYIFELDDIEHDPYVLMSILHALHDGEWTFNDVKGTLSMLFDRQYILTETVKTEIRYRTVTKTYINPYTGLPYQVQEQEAYYYYIITVTLENFNLSHLPVYIMSEARLSRYAVLMQTLGNRPDLFPVGSYPNASVPKEFLKYDIPQAYLNADPRFAAMIAEANKYLGMPYVWGGSNPGTSFDCSGFVSWVMNQTGWDIGRLGARGLHSYSTEVPASQARPGDLVFFHNTYRAEYPDQATHVGIYVGDGMMIHAGDPIGYTSIETSYWQSHLLAFGRIY